MIKEDYIKITEERLSNNSKEIMIKQIDNYYKSKDEQVINKYNIGDSVYLKKGTLLHGTFKNIDGLKEIVKEGIISSWFTDSRETKYPSSVGVWNLNNDFYLKDYINYYSGATIKYFNQTDKLYETEVISFNDMSNIMNRIISKGYLTWNMEQTKEARFMPSLVQNKVQIGIIINAYLINKYEIIKGDILNPDFINDIDVKDFVNKNYYSDFICDRKNKDDFFTNRESAILFGIPANFIEGILVGKEYENNHDMLNNIKSLLPNSYICNLDGIVIK